MSFYEHDSGADPISVAYDQRLVPWLFEHWVDPLVGLASVRSSDQVVDLACGTGLIARSVVQYLDESGRIHAVDLDSAMLAYAASTVSSPSISWHEADVSDLPLGTSTIDVSICHQGLQFFPEPDRVLAEVKRILRPGGRLAVAVWGPLEANPWPAAMATAVGEFLGADAREGTVSVCGLGDAEVVKSLLVDGDFVDVEVAEVELMARHTNVNDAIDGQLAAVPYALSIDALGPDRRRDLIETMAYQLEDYTASDGSIAVPSTSVFGTATVPL